MNETQTTSEQTRQGTGIPAESTHFYFKDGRPCYTVPRSKGDGERPTTLADARKLDLVPSVTAILNVAAKPGLEAWKAKQILESALTLPRIDGESLDDYALRVVEDSKAYSQKARDKGTELHAAIEIYIQDKGVAVMTEWEDHILAVASALMQHGINIKNGKAEHSFASPLGFGGKLDWHQDRISDTTRPQDTWQDAILLDFKTKEKIDEKKQLVWPEHVQQLAAYGFGLFDKIDHLNLARWAAGHAGFRALNVFVGTGDKQVRVFEHEWPDLVEAFAQFRCLLEYWCRIKKFGRYAKDK